MSTNSSDLESIDQQVGSVFALVTEAVAGATHALLSSEPEVGQAIVDADKTIDELTARLDRIVWERIDSGCSPTELRHLVAVLLILPELERSADLAEHVAQRAIYHLGAEMTPASRGIVQRMSDVALSMWRATADAYADKTAVSLNLFEADEELDDLHARLTAEVASAEIPLSVAAQVTLLARFYERIGDHAVNLARRIAALVAEQQRLA